MHGVVQGKKGFIWVYNEFKLHRFDGRNFERYTIPHGLPGSDEGIRGGLVYQDSFLISLGEKHLFLLNTQTGVWQSHALPLGRGVKKYYDFLHIIGQNEIRMLESSQNRDTIRVWSFKNNQFSRAPFPDIIPAATIWNVGPDGKLYQYSGLYARGDTIEVWEPQKEEPRKIALNFLTEDAIVNYVVPFKNNMLALYASLPAVDTVSGFNDGLYSLNYVTGEMNPHPVNHLLAKDGGYLHFFNILENEDILFAGGDRQLYHYNARLDTLYDYSPLAKLHINNVNDFGVSMTDDNETIWLGSQLGLVKVVLKETTFETYFSESLVNCNGYCSFRGMAEDAQGNIFASFYQGIAQFTPKDKEAKTFFSNSEYEIPLPSNLYVDKNGLWLNNGTVLDIQTGKIDTVSGSKEYNYNEEGFFHKRGRWPLVVDILS